MNLKTTLLFSMAFLFACGIQAQVYVKSDSGGSNDGTSWANAFTSLDDALTSSSAGDQIWVAAGTYKPNGGTVTDFFTFPHDLELYGGFAGTESMLSERDWIANQTILSGDHAGDDIVDNFVDNRADNSMHVLWLTDTVTIASTLDGFTIRNGHTAPEAGSGNERRGGGILTYGALSIRNCHFTQNYGWFGGSLYPRGGAAAGIIVENCVFEKNNGQFGAAVYLNPPSATVSGCTFSENTSVSLGGAFYNNTSGGTIVTNCTFTDNQSTGSRGGGVYNTTSPSTFSNCTFAGNSAAASSGGGLQVRHTDAAVPVIEVIVEDCTFEGNTATFGGAMGCYDRLSIVKVSDCTFSENTSQNVGGALSNAFGARTDIENCTFFENESGLSGGAVYSQNDSAVVNVVGSSISINTSNTGGAISISGDGNALSTLPRPMLTVRNTEMFFNISNEQGAGINMSNSNMRLENVLMYSNINLSTERYGGAMSLNTSDSIQNEFLILNSTIADNSANLGAGIAHWEGGESSVSELRVQNSIFANPNGDNYIIESGSPDLVSNGGNLSTDGTMASALTNTNDLNEDDPQFVDAEDEDYQLQDGSPCIDAGINDGAPLTDIEGLPRVGEVDMGAFENQMLSAVSLLKVKFGKLAIFPNPVEAELKFTFESNWRGEVDIRIVDMAGRTIFHENIDKKEEALSGAYPVSHLPKGQYELTVSNGKLNNTVSFVK